MRISPSGASTCVLLVTARAGFLGLDGIGRRPEEETARASAGTGYAAGSAAWGPGLATLGGITVGDTLVLQRWYRDPTGGPSITGANFTNGLGIGLNP